MATATASRVEFVRLASAKTLYYGKREGFILLVV